MEITECGMGKRRLACANYQHPRIRGKQTHATLLGGHPVPGKPLLCANGYLLISRISNRFPVRSAPRRWECVRPILGL